MQDPDFCGNRRARDVQEARLKEIEEDRQRRAGEIMERSLRGIMGFVT